MSTFKTMDDYDLRSKRVLVRVDLNVPMKDGKPTNAERIERTAPTVKALVAKGARVILLTHLGRPKGKKDPQFSVKPLVEPLSAAIGIPVAFVEDCVGPVAQSAADKLRDGEVLLLENVRFYAEETANDAAFSRQLADLADVYVNDAFSSAHRAHSSTEGIAHLLPSAAGRLMQEELVALGKALENPARPLAAIVGGAKVSTKLELLGNLVKKVDVLIIGGGMANTFLFAKGYQVGMSLCEKDMAQTARDIMEAAQAAGCDIVLPLDGAISPKFEPSNTLTVVSIENVPEDQMILDAGAASIDVIKEKLAACKTLVWNGPLGAFEMKPFDRATVAIAQYAAERVQTGQMMTVAGGGDTVSALVAAGVKEKVSYVSTAGGAFLEWLEGKTLPGVAALS